MDETDGAFVTPPSRPPKDGEGSTGDDCSQPASLEPGDASSRTARTREPDRLALHSRATNHNNGRMALELGVLLLTLLTLIVLTRTGDSQPATIITAATSVVMILKVWQRGARDRRSSGTGDRQQSRQEKGEIR